MVHTAEIGLLLAACLYGGEPLAARQAVEGLTLTRVEISAPAGYVSITAYDALLHPLLIDWLCVSLFDALAQPLLAEMTLSNLAAGAPFFRSVDFCDVEGAGLCGQASLHFAHVNAEVLIHYGETATADGLTNIRRASGNALCGVGRALRDGPSSASAIFGSIVAELCCEQNGAPADDDREAAARAPMGFHQPGTVH